MFEKHYYLWLDFGANSQMFILKMIKMCNGILQLSVNFKFLHEATLGFVMDRIAVVNVV